MGENIQPLKQEPMVEISKDAMQATMFLPKTETEGTWTKNTILKFLDDNGISHGIDKFVVLELSKGRMRNQTVVIAKGSKVKAGRDGYFEFLFNTEVKPRPKMNEDGSVDYYHIDCFEPVKEGQLLARYHKAEKGEPGMSVKGDELPSRPGKDLPPLKGKGFLFDEGKGTYTAEISGKVELLDGKKLMVTSVYQVNGCVDYSVGNIDFDGDVVIRQDVLTGFCVKATGSVFVDGCVEAAVIEAGQDIVLKNGMQGGEKGRITAGGNVMAKFFEAAFIKAGGNLTANVIMNSQVLCTGSVSVLGKFGSIIGGYVWGMEGIITTRIGNIAQTKTTVEAGILQKHLDKLEEIEEQLDKKRDELIKLEEVRALLKKRSKLKKTPEQAEVLAERKQMVLNSIQVKEEEIELICRERAEKQQILRKYLYVQIQVLGMVHKGSKIRINTAERRIEKGCHNIAAEVKGNAIVLHSLENEE